MNLALLTRHLRVITEQHGICNAVRQGLSFKFLCPKRAGYVAIFNRAEN
jgi:hypothetical protein